MRLSFATCMLYRRTHTYVTEALTTPSPWAQPLLLTESAALHLKQRDIICFTPSKSFITGIHKHFSCLCRTHLATAPFICRASPGLIKRIHCSKPPICSFLFLFTLLHLVSPFGEPCAVVIPSGCANMVPESQLSRGENLPADWQERAPKHPCCHLPGDTRASSVKASLKTWSSGHSAKSETAWLFLHGANIKHGKDARLWKFLIVYSCLLTALPLLIL